MVSISCLSSPFTNCCARVSSYCSEHQKGLVTTAKVAAYFACVVGTFYLPVPQIAKGAICYPLGFLAINTMISHAWPVRNDRWWLRMGSTLGLESAAGVSAFSSSSLAATGITLIAFTLGMSITRSGAVCCDCDDDYVPIGDGSAQLARPLSPIEEEPIALENTQ